MTAIATILALIPMALGIGGKGGFLSTPLAVVVIGGLFTSTFLTLILVPVLYLALRPAAGRGGRLRAGRRGGTPLAAGGGAGGVTARGGRSQRRRRPGNSAGRRRRSLRSIWPSPTPTPRHVRGRAVAKTNAEEDAREGEGGAPGRGGRG